MLVKKRNFINNPNKIHSRWILIMSVGGLGVDVG